MFFDEYERFFRTSKVYPTRDRLNLRYEAILAANADILDGARVLDIAAHDGRWSFAALQTGAAHVTALEARKELVDNATDTFRQYGVDPSRYRFVSGDVFDVLAQEDLDVDVVLCLGFFYHTYRHPELLHHIRALNPTYVIVDSYVVPGLEQPFVKLFTDRPDVQGKAILDRYGHDQRTLVGRPSVPALRKMLEVYGFGVEQLYDWATLLETYPQAQQVNDYRDGWRVTLRARSRAVAGASTSKRESGTANAAAGTAAGTAAGAPSAGKTSVPAATSRSRGAANSSRGQRWRHVINRSLARATGYELRRVS